METRLRRSGRGQAKKDDARDQDRGKRKRDEQIKASKNDEDDEQQQLPSYDYLPQDPESLMREKTQHRRWCTVESDPAVFSQILQEIGVQGAKVAELYSLDSQELSILPQAYGLIFLFRWESHDDDDTEHASPSTTVTRDSTANTPWFASQVADNACASLALLNIILNLPDSTTTPTASIDTGEYLRLFKSFTADFNYVNRGLALANFDRLRSIHNKFARAVDVRSADIDICRAAADASAREKKKTKKKRKRGRRNADDIDDDEDDDSDDQYEDEEAFHFIGFVPFENALWELDGLTGAPKQIGSSDNWIETAISRIRHRIERYAADEIRFNLMAVVKDALYEHRREIRARHAILREVEVRLEKVLAGGKWQELLTDEAQLARSFRGQIDMELALAMTDSESEELELVRKLCDVDELARLHDEKRKALIDAISDARPEEIANEDRQNYALKKQFEYSPFVRTFIAELRKHNENFNELMS
ncbi:hypothetical protein BZA70DRAFT_14620 [Myxozyma melibiosi]|uniref:ubiquitinyl hydrolase 1 n=1 Tax=Myxozyma melibiosi TaxID=54550 RepID=A0ABR1FC86_9ASCO